MKHKLVRKVCMMLALTVLCSCLAIPCAPAEELDPIDKIMEGMSLRDKLSQMMFVCMRTWKEDTASDAPAERIHALNEPLRDMLSAHSFGGILLVGENIADAEQTMHLIADLQATSLSRGGLPMFIAADQEGGTVSRIGFGTTGPGNMMLSATGDPDNAHSMARVYAEEMSLLGLNEDFAPVADVNDNPANPVIGVRSFGDDAQSVAEYVRAYVQGLQDAGIIATLKHFPGHGNTDTDSHTGLPLVNRTHDELMANELVPFKAGIEAGADMVMTAHIQFPQLEKQTYTSITTGEEVYIPATMSRAIMTDLLRGELGFDGVIVSDALEMSAIWDNYAMDDVLTMTINAGVDMLIPPSVYDASGLELVEEMLDRAVSLTESGIIDARNIDAAVRRILLLKRKYGILDRTNFALSDEAIVSAINGCGSPEHRQIAWDIACQGLTLLKSENNAFPIHVKAGETALILHSAASRFGASEVSHQLLEDMQVLPEGFQINSLVVTPETAQDCMDAALTADHVIVVSRAWEPGCLNPATENGYPVGVINDVISAMHEIGKPVIVISAQLPYDAACYPEADAILLAYGSSAMPTAPNASGAGSAWAPNLPAAICAAFGTVVPGGRLPVNLPMLDESCAPTDIILYPRSSGLAASDTND